MYKFFGKSSKLENSFYILLGQWLQSYLQNLSRKKRQFCTLSGQVERFILWLQRRLAKWLECKSQTSSNKHHKLIIIFLRSELAFHDENSPLELLLSLRKWKLRSDGALKMTENDLFSYLTEKISFQVVWKMMSYFSLEKQLSKIVSEELWNHLLSEKLL